MYSCESGKVCDSYNFILVLQFKHFIIGMYLIKFLNTRAWELSKDQEQCIIALFNICIWSMIILLNLSFDYFLFFNFNFHYSLIFSYYRLLDVQCTLRTNIILCLKKILGTSILLNLRQSGMVDGIVTIFSVQLIIIKM